jgi:hypothetical protein
MRTSIPKTRERSERSEREHMRSTSLRALAIAARLERGHGEEGPPGHAEGRADHRRTRRTPDPA